jgi:hypothetical protein
MRTDTPISSCAAVVDLVTMRHGAANPVSGGAAAALVRATGGGLQVTATDVSF